MFHADMNSAISEKKVKRVSFQQTNIKVFPHINRMKLLNMKRKNINKLWLLLTAVVCLFLSCAERAMLGVGNAKDYKRMIENGNLTLDDFQHYQTFDEFSMKGAGLAVSEPYVCVRKQADTIIVVSSDTIQVRGYVKYGGWWYNHMEFDMDKKGELPLKESSLNPARVYDRFLCNDTIVEYKTYYWDNVAYRDLYIKTKNKCEMIPVEYDENFNTKAMISCIQLIVDAYRRGEIFAIKRYVQIEREFTYVLKCDAFMEVLMFKKNSLGLWGIQPGFDCYDRFLSIRSNVNFD